MIAASSSTVSQIIARCSRPRPRFRASAPRALRRSLDLDDLLGLPKLGLRTLGASPQLRDLAIAAIGRLAPARLGELLQRPVLAQLTPRRQMRRVQPLPPQQLADLPRPRARLGLLEDLQLVLSREPPALRPLDQLRITCDSWRSASARRLWRFASGPVCA